jgi:hypothetical protein
MDLYPAVGSWGQYAGTGGRASDCVVAGCGQMLGLTRVAQGCLACGGIARSSVSADSQPIQAGGQGRQPQLEPGPCGGSSRPPQWRSAPALCGGRIRDDCEGMINHA